MVWARLQQHLIINFEPICNSEGVGLIFMEVVDPHLKVGWLLCGSYS